MVLEKCGFWMVVVCGVNKLFYNYVIIFYGIFFIRVFIDRLRIKFVKYFRVGVIIFL